MYEVASALLLFLSSGRCLLMLVAMQASHTLDLFGSPKWTSSEGQGPDFQDVKMGGSLRSPHLMSIIVIIFLFQPLLRILEPLRAVQSMHCKPSSQQLCHKRSTTCGRGARKAEAKILGKSGHSTVHVQSGAPSGRDGSMVSPNPLQLDKTL